MRCDQINKSAYRELDDGVCIEKYKIGMEDVWIRVQKSAGEFSEESDEKVKEYFLNRFDQEKLEKRCIFLKDIQTKTYIGTCIAWEEEYEGNEIPVLHWLAISDAYSGKGYARMLITQVMQMFENIGQYPIYLHTQPWSYKAIKLYNDFGFNMCKSDYFCDAENEYELAMPILRKVMECSAYRRLEESCIK